MKVGIVGAGITGLSAAYELAKKGHTVTIFERGSVPGGLGTYIPVGGSHLERYYHHFFRSDKLIARYATELGIGEKLKYYPSKNGVFISGKMYNFNTPQDLLRYTELSFFNRLRCACTLAFFKLMPIPLWFLDSISAATWIKRFAGQQVYEKLWGPLLEGKFSEFASTVPALWLWGRIYDRTFKLGYFNGSVKLLFDALIAKISDLGGEIRLNAEVMSVEQEGEVVVVVEKGTRYMFDKVVMTTVSPITAEIIKGGLSEESVARMRSVDHLGAVCLILELSRSVQSCYWVNICEKHAPVLVMVEHTNLIPSEAYQGVHLVYLANYIHRNNPRFRMSDEEVFESYTSILKKINKDFDRSWIRNHYVSRVPRAQTIFKLNAWQNKPPIKTSVKNVYMVNIDQMYPHDRNLNQGIELGMKVVDEILAGR